MIDDTLRKLRRSIQRGQAQAEKPLFAWTAFGGVTAGAAVMNPTVLLVTA